MIVDTFRELIDRVTPSTPRSPSHPRGGKGTPPPGRLATLGGMVAAAALWARPVLACPVCYGEADNAVIDGAKLSVIFMGALVYVLIGGGVALAVIVHRRAVKNLDPHRGLRLLPPERG